MGRALGTNHAAVVAFVVLFALVAVMQARVWAHWRAVLGGGEVRPRYWVTRTLIGLVVGILKQTDPDTCNDFVEISIATGMDDARNAIITNTGVAAPTGSMARLESTTPANPPRFSSA